MKMKRKWIKRLIVLLCCFGMIAFASTLFNTETSAPVYRTAKVTRGNISEVVNTVGTLKPISEVNVGTQASGTVDHVYVRVNDAVKKGQLLAEIDPSLMASQLKQTQANLETARINFDQAKRDLKRTKMLLAKDYVAKIDLEHAEQAYQSAQNYYDSAKSQVERDRLNLSYTKVFSPIDGVVILQDTTLGQTLASNFQTPNLFKIAQELSSMKIELNLSESDISKVRVGMKLTFSVDAYPERAFEGIIDSINLDANAQQRGPITYMVTVLVNNKDRALRPGMTAYANIILAEHTNVLRIPAAALRFVPPQEKNGGLADTLSNVGLSGQVGNLNVIWSSSVCSEKNNSDRGR